MDNIHLVKKNIKDLSTSELKDYTHFIFQTLRVSLKKNLHFDLKVFGDWQVLKSNDFTITFKGKASFLNIKMRGYQIKTSLKQGFLISFDDLLKISATYETLPFYNEIINIKEKLSIYQFAANSQINLSKIYIYCPLNGEGVHYFLVFDTGDSLIFISDIPELEDKNITFMRNIYDGFYVFVHSKNNFNERLEQVFFNQYKWYRPDATHDDFLVDLMKSI